MNTLLIPRVGLGSGLPQILWFLPPLSTGWSGFCLNMGKKVAMNKTHQRSQGQKKRPRLFWLYIFNQSTFQKIFEGEMLVRTKETTFRQMVCEFIFNFTVIIKNILSPNNNLVGTFKH